MEESKSQLDLGVNLRIDLADLIEREQIKTRMDRLETA